MSKPAADQYGWRDYLRVVFLLEVLFAVFLAGLRVVLFFVVFFLFIAKAESTSFTCEMVDAPFSSFAGINLRWVKRMRPGSLHRRGQR
ncbi:MAG: hypothetical protein ACREAA_19795 [Candidatus Polarisedimenticolia bacterium]